MTTCTDQWEGCYETGWRGWIVPDAFAHPAKFSRCLIERIYDHAYEMGWIRVGDRVLDPFTGVALGGLYAMSSGLNWVGVELEEKFVKLGEQNIELWNRQLKGWPNLGTARIVQGDSRNLKEAIERADIVVSSPPYAESLNPETEDQTIRKQERIAKSKTIYDGRKLETLSPGKAGLGGGYGINPDNLGSMKEGNFDCVVSSPPYAGSNAENVGGRQKRALKGIPDKVMKLSGAYGIGEDNLGNTSGDTFWSASREIVFQCYDLLKYGGHAIWVCKDYVKNKKRVPFSDRWLALNESVGFKLICRHQAMLIGVNKKGEYVERKSFFRRLAESKGSPRIDWEDVICLIKK